MSVVAYPLNNVDYTAEDAMLYNCSRTSGVLDEDGNLDISITGDREITIGTGIAWIRYQKLAGLAVGVREAERLDVAISEALLDRIDTVVLGFSAAENAAKLYIKQGAPSSEAERPALEKSESVYELGLYDITVTAGSIAITEDDITDTRADDERCGYMYEIGAVLQRALQYYAPLESPNFNGEVIIDGVLANYGIAVLGCDAEFVQVNAKHFAVDYDMNVNGNTEFLNTPTAPTPDKTDNSTKLATTAYVQQVAGGGTRKLVATFTSSGTFNPANYPSIGNKYDIEMCGGGQGGGKYYNDIYYGFGGNAGETVQAFGVYIGSSISIEVGAGSDAGSNITKDTATSTYSFSSANKAGDTRIKELRLLARGGGYSLENSLKRPDEIRTEYFVGSSRYYELGSNIGIHYSQDAWNDDDSMVKSQPSGITAGVSYMSSYGNGGKGSDTSSTTPASGTSGVVKIYAYQ